MKCLGSQCSSNRLLGSTLESYIKEVKVRISTQSCAVYLVLIMRTQSDRRLKADVVPSRQVTHSLTLSTYALALGTSRTDILVSNLCCGISYGGTQFRVPKCSQNTVDGIFKVCFECETIFFDLQY